MASSVPPQDRLNHFDAARAFFMLLGIPYHAALAYGPNAHWLLSSPDRSSVLGAFAFVTQSFRMPGFFLIAGFFAAMLLARRGRGEWLRARLTRLGVPFLTAMLLLVPVQAWMLGRLEFSPGRILEAIMPHGPNPFDYLWFLPSMMQMCVLLALFWKPLCRAADGRAFAALSGSRFIWPVMGLAAGFWLIAMQLYPMLLGTRLSFAGGLIDFDHMLANLPWFLAGALCGRSGTLRAALERFRWSTLAIGLGALAVYAACADETTRPLMAVTDLTSGIAALSIAACLFALLARFAALPSVWVRRWVDASLTIYLLHHPIVVMLVILFIKLHGPPLLEWAAISVVTLAISYAVHGLVRRSALTLFLLNGIPMKHAGRRGLLVRRARAEPNS